MNHYDFAEFVFEERIYGNDEQARTDRLIRAHGLAVLALVDKLDELKGTTVLDVSTLADPGGTVDTPTFGTPDPGSCQPVHCECVLSDGHDGDHIDTEGRYRDE